ncbi:MAG: hypothetical protein ACUZ8E_18195, partial [Candidatus Anammoxibacter sp.]
NASASGDGASVFPNVKKTGFFGTADFVFGFGLVTRDAKITFTTEGLSTTIIQGGFFNFSDER